MNISFDILKALKESIFFIIPVAISLTTYLYVRKNRFYFIQVENIQLFNKKSFQIPDIKIKYKKNDVNEYFRFVQGSVILKGVDDVKPSDIFSKLKIILGDDQGKWESFNITSSTQEMDPSYHIVNNKVIFEKILFKNEDCINFEGIYTSKNEVIRVNHRFYNVASEVLNINLTSTKIYLGNLIFFVIVILGYLYFLFSVNKNVFPEYFKSFDEMNVYDFETIFVNNENEIIDIDSIPILYEHSSSFKNELKLYNRITDSLESVFKNDVTSDNFKNLMSHKIYKPSTNYGFTLKAEMINTSDNILEKELKSKNLKIDVPYTYNDSIFFKFKYKNHYLDENGKAPTGIIIINILFLAVTAYLIYAIPRTYLKYYTLNRIIRKTRKNAVSL
ncbi:MAG: hypothetical protein Q4G18_03350 [Myroides sp.]|nr:hypothetical protein [Myroides sp.]